MPPVYRITRPVSTWNPIKINFQHVWLLIQDAWRTRSWKDKFTLWFKPTGYRPADVAEKYPVHKIDDVYHFNKYDTPVSPAFSAWCWIQLVMILLFISYLFGNISLINNLDKYYIFWYSGFVFVSVYAITDLMDGNASAIMWEAVRCSIGLTFVFDQQDWFGASVWLENIQWIIGAYLVFSLFMTGWFVAGNKKEEEKMKIIL